MVRKFAIIAVATMVVSGCGLLNHYRHSNSVVHNYDKATGNPNGPTSTKPAVRIGFYTEPTNGIQSLSFFRYIQVAGYDEDGQITKSFVASVSLSLASSNRQLGGAITVSPQNGIATFESIYIDEIGSYKIAANSDKFETIESKNFQIYARFSGGDGALATPYEIGNIYQLQGLAYTYSDYTASFFKITSDIDASETSTWHGGSGFLPIGSSATPFGQTFDGGKKTVSSLKIKRPTETRVGLFGALNASADVHNIILTKASVVGNDMTGMFVGESTSAKIYNLVGIGSVSGRNKVGGMVGYSSGSGGFFTALYARADVSGTDDVGGLVGALRGNAPIKYSMADIVVSASGLRAGGGVGSVDAQNNLNTVFELAVHGSTYAAKGYAGGVIGRALNGESNQLAAQGSVQSGDTTGMSFAGGLVGYAENFNIKGSNADTSVYASGARAGGLVGHAASLTLTSNHAMGSVRASTVAGGLVGYAETIQFNFNGASGKVQASSALGGIIGTALSLSSYKGNFFHKADANSSLNCIYGAADTAQCAGVPLRQHGLFDDIIFSKATARAVRVSAADASSFFLNGECNITSHGTAVDLAFSRGATTIRASTTCTAGRWEASVDLSSLSDGNIIVTATLRGAGSAPSLTLRKVTTLCQSSNSAASGFSSGSGTLADPYVLCSRTQFLAMSSKRNVATPFYFKLGANIDLSPVMDAPMGTLAAADCAGLFCHVLDGDGFVLTNAVMTMVSDSAGILADGSSLFGETGTVSAVSAEIKNLNIKGARILGNSHVSVVASKLLDGGTIDNVLVDASVLSSGNYTGGLIGWQQNSSLQDSGTNILLLTQGTYAGLAAGTITGASAPSITNVSTDGVVSGTGSIGGMVGNIADASVSVTAARSSATVIANSSYAGGFVGDFQQGNIQTSYAIGDVLSTSADAGGFVGLSGTSTNLGYSYAAGAVAAAGNVGGFVGRVYGSVLFSFAAAPYTYADSSNGFFLGDVMATGSADFFSYATTVYASAYYGANSGIVNMSSWTAPAGSITTFDGVIPGGSVPTPVDSWSSGWRQNINGLPLLDWE